MEITLIISMIGCVIAISSFVLARKDKAVSECKEGASEQKLINYRLNELSKKVDIILEKMDTQDDEVRKIEEKMEKYVLKYHS